MWSPQLPAFLGRHPSLSNVEIIVGDTLTASQFEQSLKLSKLSVGLRSSSKQFKEYFDERSGIVYQNHDNAAVKVFCDAAVEIERHEPFVYRGVSRRKLSMSSVSSSTKTRSRYVKTLTFHVSNRMSLVYETSVTDEQAVVYNRVFVTYSHDECVDMSTVGVDESKVLSDFT